MCHQANVHTDIAQRMPMCAHPMVHALFNHQKQYRHPYPQCSNIKAFKLHQLVFQPATESHHRGSIYLPGCVPESGALLAGNNTAECVDSPERTVMGNIAIVDCEIYLDGVAPLLNLITNLHYSDSFS